MFVERTECLWNLQSVCGTYRVLVEPTVSHGLSDCVPNDCIESLHPLRVTLSRCVGSHALRSDCVRCSTATVSKCV